MAAHDVVDTPERAARPKHSRAELLHRSIDVLCHERWERGLAVYRRSADEPFAGDALAELIEELLDALNYGAELYRQEQSPYRANAVQAARYYIRSAIEVLRCRSWPDSTAPRCGDE